MFYCRQLNFCKCLTGWTRKNLCVFLSKVTNLLRRNVSKPYLKFFTAFLWFAFYTWQGFQVKIHLNPFQSQKGFLYNLYNLEASSITAMTPFRYFSSHPVVGSLPPNQIFPFLMIRTHKTPLEAPHMAAGPELITLIYYPNPIRIFSKLIQ